MNWWSFKVHEKNNLSSLFTRRKLTGQLIVVVVGEPAQLLSTQFSQFCFCLPQSILLFYYSIPPIWSQSDKRGK